MRHIGNIMLVLAAALVVVPTVQARPFATPAEERPVYGFDGDMDVVVNSAVCGSAERASGPSNAAIRISTADMWQAVVTAAAGSGSHSLRCGSCNVGCNSSFASGQMIHLFLSDKEDGNESSVFLWNDATSQGIVDVERMVKSGSGNRADSMRPDMALKGSYVARHDGAINLRR